MKAEKYVVFCIAISLIVVMASFSLTQATDTLAINNSSSGVVQKNNGDTFTVKLNVKNTGDSAGNFSINVTFEGDSWIWKGTEKTLTLAAGESKQLVWQGSVPNNAKVGSTARLVAYYDEQYKALNWWIQVVSCSALSITSSFVN